MASLMWSDLLDLYGIDSMSRNYIIYSGLSDSHPRPRVLPLGRERVELPKGWCLRRLVCAREP